uniref:Putative chimeric protein 173-56 n=1 Tax=Trypanosoma cruzi TaxID=5693 RepID=Q6RV10_TRYCR|nr:putative chimeric protein 173-56 [Trypanosoma cruzi]
MHEFSAKKLNAPPKTKFPQFLNLRIHLKLYPPLPQYNNSI